MRAFRAFSILWIALAIALVVRTGVRDRGVITDHLEFGRRVLAGEDLYAPYLEPSPLHAPYPPGFGLLCAPLSLAPERAARFVWGLAQVAALLVIARRLFATLETVAPALRRRAHLLLLLTLLVGARYVLRDTHGGGGNLINLALGLSACGLAARGRALAGGLCLGISLATKPNLVLLAPLLWVLGFRRAVALAGGVALAWTGAALALLGQGLAPLARWAEGSLAYARMEDVFATPELGFPPFTWMNQSLRCALARFLGEVPSRYAGQVPWFFQGLGLAPGAIAWITRAVAGALLAATFAVAWRTRTRSASRPWLVAATLLLGLLLSPITWKAHHVGALPALWLLLARALDGRPGARVAVALYWLATQPGAELVGKPFKEVQQSLYLVTWATLALWGWTLHGAWRAASRQAAAPS